ncbi:type IV pilus assembly protein PilE [Pseudomonas nitritireducens]|uniref:Type IV pilus assembly protein PilE n=1 Tax=Pseudomonas nitroreducens TaxID=46680 RepID=A0A7W7KPK2_PSENT|nr:type IV pilin protein [Pseudomonas nitritireducens]MBB4866609.1 type IV pilus assembly protein PilE [Pseudomonas nitritireducens]
MKAVRAMGGGFTLLELLVTLALMGILLAIALPSYQEHIRRAGRVEAQKSLVELAQYLERYYSSQGSYREATLPFLRSPRSGGPVRYRLGFGDVPDAAGFTLIAEPQGNMVDDRCGTLTLTSSGLRGAAAERCW